MFTLLSKSEAQAMSLYPSPSWKPHSCLPFLNPQCTPEKSTLLPLTSSISTVIIRIPGVASLTLGLLLFNPFTTGIGSFLKCKEWWVLPHKLPKAVRMGKLNPQRGSQGLHRPSCFCLRCLSWSSCPRRTVLSKLEWSLWAFRHAVTCAWNHSPQPFPTSALLLFLIFCLKVTFSRKLFLIPKINQIPWLWAALAPARLLL